MLAPLYPAGPSGLSATEEYDCTELPAAFCLERRLRPEEEAAGGAAGDRKQQHVVDAFMAATGQVVSLKPLKPRGSRGGRDAGGAPGKKEQAGAGCAGAGATRPHFVH